MIPPLAVSSNLVRAMLSHRWLIEEFCLGDCILACRGVEGRGGSHGGPQDIPPDDPFDFLKFFHEIDFGVKPSRCIDEDKIHLSGLCSMDGVESTAEDPNLWIA